MTLEELLLLLPTNTSGQISAADMRTITTELWNQTDALRVQLIEVRDGSIPAAQAAATAAQSQAEATNARLDAIESEQDYQTVSSRYAFNNAAGANPGNGDFTTDTGNVTTATMLRFDDRDARDVDMGNVISAATGIFAQEADNTTNWSRWTVSGAVTELDGDWSVPVTRVEGGGLPIPNNSEVVFVFTIPTVGQV